MAARDTRVLKDAKEQLEKRLEEMTWRLQLEKQLRNDLEDVKNQDIMKFQDALHAMQLQVEKANSMLIREKESARKVIEDAPPVIKEVPVLVEDTEKINCLTAEIENLKALLLQEKNSRKAMDQAYEDLVNKNDELIRTIDVAEQKIGHLQEYIQRLEDKVANLESENQVLRQQALSMRPNPETTIIEKELENVDARNEVGKRAQIFTPPLLFKDQFEGRSQILNNRLRENQDLLIKCISQELGFSGGRPIAACIIYKCLLHWRSFEMERTTIFDRIIQTMGSAIETQEDNNVLSYWLANSSTLLLLMHRLLKASGSAKMTSHRWRSTDFFGRMAQGIYSSSQIEAKYPALFFKQQLTAFLEKIHGSIQDNLKMEISSLIGLCIQAPKLGLRSKVHATAQKFQSDHWQSVVKIIDDYMKTLKANFVSPYLIRNVFTEIFSFIDVQLFNSLLLRRECCSFSNGEYLKSGLAELEHWCFSATEEYVGSAWEELKHIRQAVEFLVMHEKPKKNLKEISKGLCSELNIQQLYRISTMYWDDRYGTHSVSAEVISTMRSQIADNTNNAVSNSFLLDDDSGIPFSLENMSKSLKEIDISKVDPPSLIRGNSAFLFLL